MRVTNQNIYNVLEAIRMFNTTVTWEQIRAAMEDSGMNIKNWMTVRNVLQFMKDEGKFIRTEDIHAEEYNCVKAV